MKQAKQEAQSPTAQDACPLSPIQQGMLFHALQDDHAGVDIEQILCAFREDLVVPAFRRAWEKVTQRHAILRSRFRWEDVNEPLQIVCPQAPLPFCEHDWRGLPPAEQLVKLNRLLETDRQAGFNLAEAPLMRFNLACFGERDYRFLWTFHHALLDGRSFPIVLKEAFAFYEAELRGETVELPLPRPYREYIEWLSKKDFEKAQSYWKSRLHGFTHPTSLGVDGNVNRIVASGRAYQEKQIKFSEVETASLKRFAEEHGVTPNTLLQAAWAILLSRYSGEEDVVFGGTRACRATALPGADAMVGIFINTLPVRTSVDPERPFLAWLKELRNEWIAMREHEQTPLARVQSWSDLSPGLPLFESIVVFENFLLDSRMRSLGGAWANREFTYYGQTNFPVTVMGYLGQELLIVLGHDQRRIAKDAAARMLGHLRTLLLGMMANPGARVGDVPMLTEAERGELIHEWNQTVEYPVECCVHELVEAQSSLRPDAMALACELQSLTYAELDRRANQLAHHLRDSGVGPEVLVALCLERSLDMVVAVLAVLKAGGAYLPLDLAYPRERLAFMLEDAQVGVLITQESLKERAPSVGGLRVISVDGDRKEIAGRKDTKPDSGVRPHNLAYVIYTSGSTGKPKGVLVTHANVVRLFRATENWYHFDERDVWTLFHSYAFDFSVWEIWGALIYGGKLVVVPYLISRSPEAFYELLRKSRVTVLNQTPSAFHQLIQVEETSSGAADLALRYVIFGGEALELQSLRPWFGRHGDQRPQLVNMYGITETTVHVTYRPLSKADLDGAPGSVIGVPLPDLELYVLDRNGSSVPIGVAGELYVGGAGVSRGYLRRDQLTAERFIPHPFRPGSNARLYRTGDLGRFLPGRDLEYLGRADDQVKIRGFRIELGEVESVLCQHPNVQKAVVIARKESSGNKRLAAYLVAAPDGNVSVTSLREFLKQTLPEYMVPAAFVWMERLPLTPNGKIDRKALPEPEPERPDLGSSFVAPRTPVEKTLARIWSEVLRVERVGIEDNFFELGGDSILTIQIVARARRAGLKLKPDLLFKHPRIIDLALVAGMTGDTRFEQGLVSGDVPLTPIQKWFFEQNLEESQHYNQTFLFEVVERLDRSLLERALKELARHHDALRFRYARAESGWQQHYSAPEETAPLIWTSVAQSSEAERHRAVEAVAASAQASLNLESGPIWRAAYFDLGPNHPGRLLIVVHHLAVDGVSWRPLLEDLEAAYQQLKGGREVQLPIKTTSYKTWANRLYEFARSDLLRNELAYWRSLFDPQRLDAALKPLMASGTSADNTEGSSRTLKVSLTFDETQALLQQVPVAYNTQINDVLLTALTRAWNRWTGSGVLFTNLEGHGREDLFEDVDLSRTVGWFTSIFPVLLEIPDVEGNWEPGEALKSVKEQLRQVPGRGVGYGILRYLCDDADLSNHPEPQVLFNYLGQFDQVLTGLRLFRFASESTGSWHSPKQRRRHLLEINSLVIDGRLELWWTHSRNFHSDETIEQFAKEFLIALRELIAHCRSPQTGGCTPSDFPLAQLDQATLDRLTAQTRDIQDIYPLSPMQTLFFTVGRGAAQSVFDQWQCTLRGELNVPAFQRAWEETVRRHSVLRSTVHADGLPEPVQVVHRRVQLPWSVEDWRGSPASQQVERWSGFLKQDSACPLPLTEAPVMRFALIRLGDGQWKFLWSVPALLLDGWSWPLVFRDVSRLYEAFSEGQSPQLEASRSYRDYIDWLTKQQSAEAERFWRETLRGFTEPTPLLGESPDADAGSERYVECPVHLSSETTGALQTMARRLQLTFNSVVQGAWALLLGRQSGRTDVVFGAAFAGRPTDLRGVESIVGPFVNNLPVRVGVNGEVSVGDFLRQVHTRLLQLNPFQFTPLMEVQRCSEVPWRHRLFDSLLVFQNYLVDESARRLGGRIEIADFVGPIHTNYPVTLLAEPGSTLRLTVIYDRQNVAGTTIARWAGDLAKLCEKLPGAINERVADLQALLSPPVAVSIRTRQRLYVQSQNYVPPQTETEQAVAGIWQQMFGLERISIEENFFDLGGHSLLLVQMHSRLREALSTDFPIVTLFEHPTIQSLAEHLSAPRAAAPTGQQWRDRAERQKAALTRLRDTLKR